MIVFGLIMVAYTLYAVIYIWETSFVVDSKRYFVLFDDAMISMRYARNLAHGHGLVWNPGGEPVEGFTNPLWVAFMAVFHLFPIVARKISLVVQMSGALFFIVSLYFTKKIAEEISSESVVSLLAVLLTAFYVQLSTWCLLGMEVSLQLLIVGAATWMALRGIKTTVSFSSGIYVLLGVGTLVRIDMGVVFVAFLTFLTIADAPNRRKHLLWGSGLLALFIGGQTLLRGLYYGDLLPNTFYLKATGAPLLLTLQRGLFVYAKFAWNFNLVLFLLPFLVILIRPDRGTVLLVWIFAVMSVYSIFVGGDAWESKGGANRFIAIVMPLWFVLFVFALERIRKGLVVNELPSAFTYCSSFLDFFLRFTLRGRGEENRYSFPLDGVTKLGLVVFAFIGLVNFNAALGISSLKYGLLLERHPFVPGSERYVRISRVLEEITTPDAKIAVLTAGIIPYFTDRYSLDLLGKVDKRIARQPVHIPENLALIDFRPGHMKWDYAYSIGQLQPDVVAQFDDSFGDPRPYLGNYTKVTFNRFPMYLRNTSTSILWEAVNRLKQPQTAN